MKTLPILLGSLVFAATAQAADPSPDACSSAYSKGQEDRLAGRLFAARASFMVCENPSCTPAVSEDCTRWRHEVEQDLPTIRLKVTDTHGALLSPTRVFADGESIPLPALAAPIILEAGPHTLRVEADGFDAFEVERALRPTDRELEVLAQLHRTGEARAAAPITEARTVPTSAWVLGGVGVASLGAALYFGLSSHNQYEDLKRECAPYCPQSSADSVRTKSIVSDVTLITGAAALGAAIWLYFGAKPRTPASTALQVTPTRNGGALRLHVTF